MDMDYEGATEIERAWREGMTPDPLLTVSEWSDRHRMLSSKASAEPGRWRTSRTPYLKAIMDCLSPTSPVERVVFMKAAQLGATEMGSNWIGYVIHHAPGPMMAVWPTVEMAKRNSKQRIDPLIEESAALAELIAPARSRDSGNTILAKEFRGGVIWEPTLAAYDQFFLDRGLFGDEPPRIEWTYITIFWRSIWQAGLATILTLLIGFPTAWFIATRPPQTRSVWLFLVTIPYWVNLLIRTVSMKFLIRDTGPLNEFLLWTGLIDQPLVMLQTDFAVYLGIVYTYLPFMILPLYANLEKLDFTLNEAAMDLGSRPWQVLKDVTLPLSLPGIIAGGLLVFIPSSGELIIPSLVGNASDPMIGRVISDEFSSARHWPMASAVAVALLMMLVVPLMVYNHFEARAQAGASKP